MKLKYHRIPLLHQCSFRCATFSMKSQTAYIIFVLTVLLSCKTSQNQSFIKSKKEKDVALTGAPTPHVLFALESGDTLKFGSRDIYSMLYERIKLQIKSQGYSSDKSWHRSSGSNSGNPSPSLSCQDSGTRYDDLFRRTYAEIACRIYSK